MKRLESTKGLGSVLLGPNRMTMGDCAWADQTYECCTIYKYWCLFITQKNAFPNIYCQWVELYLRSIFIVGIRCKLLTIFLTIWYYFVCSLQDYICPRCESGFIEELLEERRYVVINHQFGLVLLITNKSNIHPKCKPDDMDKHYHWWIDGENK